MGKASRRKTERQVRIDFRDSTEDDLEALLRIAQDRLPVAASFFEGVRDEGIPILQAETARRVGMSVSVAEVAGEVVGFATARPFSLPGGQGATREAGNLGLLAADAKHSGRGVGVGLLRHATSRQKALGAHLIVAHIPTASKTLYERAGWTVLPPERGYAWQAPGGLLLADYSTSGPEYEHLAFKQLRELSYSYSFDHIGASPIGRAAAAAIVGSFDGNFEPGLVSPKAREMFAVAAMQIASTHSRS